MSLKKITNIKRESLPDCMINQCKCVFFVLSTQVSWEVKYLGGGFACASSVHYDQTMCCIKLQNHYEIYCRDSGGYGWNGYQIRFNGVEKCAGFTDGSYRYDTIYGIFFCFCLYKYNLCLYRIF